MATTWAAGAACMAMGAAVPATIDPTAPTARMTRVRARLMRMFPPWASVQFTSWHAAHHPAGAAELLVSYCQYLAFMHKGKVLPNYFQILKIAGNLHFRMQRHFLFHLRRKMR